MIREAKAEEAGAIVDLFKVILSDMEHPVMEEVSWDELRPALVHAAKSEQFRQSYKNALVKVVDGEVVGFCFGYPGGESEEYASLSRLIESFDLPPFETFMVEETMEGEWYLDSLVTRADYRGRGVGKELMEAAYAKAHAMGLPVVGLNVDHDNPRARKLYEAQGFKKVKEVRLVDHLYDHMQKKV
ncbi:Acetyltransferase, GNAT family [Alkalibacterium sp. AK22]|uniref:GNAT family N-acetyltransferase n=1 Tax=Alkalibacterium sp. AK22 TaxID=1229520 RepID=UPI000446E749|nr:GNAT family N-acetyltransferase [Alkalibacterium sp. AK22]EXJ23493.1 Acetyltransferase, GNAT family [Alkalibacterium sp. AK22]